MVGGGGHPPAPPTPLVRLRVKALLCRVFDTQRTFPLI